jgi:Zn-dependent M28 family amino/carboxypeptidase
VTLSAENVPTSEAQRRWWDHVRYLASDTLQGRSTGSEGYRMAADYVAGEFKRAGLTEGVSGSFLQPVRFHSRRIVEEQSSLALVGADGRVQSLVAGPDATFDMRVAQPPAVDAPLVFAGYGLVVPEAHHDDLAGLDLQGAVVVYLAGGPPSVAASLRTHYQSAGVRWEAMRKAGAVGTISIANPRGMEIPWERSSPNRLLPSLVLAESAAGPQFSLAFNPAHAEKLFERAPASFAEMLRLSDAGKDVPRFRLPFSIRARVTVENAPIESPNVVGILPGSDPVLKSEFVVLSGHLDHYGVGAPIDGDAIYNGAMDNASGMATLIETAHAMAAVDRPRRSIVFLAAAGEENGLLGSQYFVQSPPVPKAAVVADINIDMFLPLFPMKMVMILGLEESDLGRTATDVAASLDLAVQSDPEPARNRFRRSDQYSFVREGIPALAIKVGYELDSREGAIAARWTSERYHAPSDDLAQPIDLQSAADFTRWVQALCAAVANRAERPQWYETSFFKRFAS